MKHLSTALSAALTNHALTVVRDVCGEAAATIYLLRRGGISVAAIAAMKGLSVPEVEDALAAADNALVDDDAAQRQNQTLPGTFDGPDAA